MKITVSIRNTRRKTRKLNYLQLNSISISSTDPWLRTSRPNHQTPWFADDGCSLWPLRRRIGTFPWKAGETPFVSLRQLVRQACIGSKIRRRRKWSGARRRHKSSLERKEHSEKISRSPETASVRLSPFHTWTASLSTGLQVAYIRDTQKPPFVRSPWN